MPIQILKHGAIPTRKLSNGETEPKVQGWSHNADKKDEQGYCKVQDWRKRSSQRPKNVESIFLFFAQQFKYQIVPKASDETLYSVLEKYEFMIESHFFRLVQKLIIQEQKLTGFQMHLRGEWGQCRPKSVSAGNLESAQPNEFVQSEKWKNSWCVRPEKYKKQAFLFTTNDNPLLPQEQKTRSRKSG